VVAAGGDRADLCLQIQLARQLPVRNVNAAAPQRPTPFEHHRTGRQARQWVLPTAIATTSASSPGTANRASWTTVEPAKVDGIEPPTDQRAVREDRVAPLQARKDSPHPLFEAVDRNRRQSRLARTVTQLPASLSPHAKTLPPSVDARLWSCAAATACTLRGSA